MGPEEFVCGDLECDDAIVLPRCEKTLTLSIPAYSQPLPRTTTEQERATPPPLKLMKSLSKSSTNSVLDNISKKRNSKDQSEQLKKRRRSRRSDRYDLSQRSSVSKHSYSSQSTSHPTSACNLKAGGRSTCNSKKRCSLGETQKPDCFRYVLSCLTQGMDPDLEEEPETIYDNDELMDRLNNFEEEAEQLECPNTYHNTTLNNDEVVANHKLAAKSSAMAKMLSLLDYGFRMECKFALETSLIRALEADSQSGLAIHSQLPVYSLESDCPSTRATNHQFNNETAIEHSLSTVKEFSTEFSSLVQHDLSCDASESGYEDGKSNAQDSLLSLSIVEDLSFSRSGIAGSVEPDKCGDIPVYFISSDEDDNYEDEVIQSTPEDDDDDPWSHISIPKVLDPPDLWTKAGNVHGVSSVASTAEDDPCEILEEIIQITDSVEETFLSSGCVNP